jgi:hypothetical protein
MKFFFPRPANPEFFGEADVVAKATTHNESAPRYDA